jgi:hypothetical protein
MSVRCVEVSVEYGGKLSVRRWSVSWFTLKILSDYDAYSDEIYLIDCIRKKLREGIHLNNPYIPQI